MTLAILYPKIKIQYRFPGVKGLRGLLIHA